MSFTRPTLPELVDRIEQDFITRLVLTGAPLRRAVVRVLSRVVAGATHMLHGHLDFLSRQLFPDTSEDEYLLRQAALFGLTPNDAGFAKATATTTGTNGTVISAGHILQRTDGAEYTTDADVTVSGGTATLAVTSSLAGADQSLDVGMTLTFQSPVTNVAATATVATDVQDGADQETIDALRVRLTARMSEPASGGSDADYIEWAKEIAGVTRVWVSDQEFGPGTVVVRFVRDNDGTGPTDFIPDIGEVAAVQTFIDSVKPAHATVTVIAPVATAFDVNVHIVPDNTATEAAVTAELKDMLLRDGVPGGTILLSAVQTAIGNAVGITDYEVVLPTTDTPYATGLIPYFDAVSFV